MNLEMSKLWALQEIARELRRIRRLLSEGKQPDALEDEEQEGENDDA